MELECFDLCWLLFISSPDLSSSRQEKSSHQGDQVRIVVVIVLLVLLLID